ncbi:MAG TPA: peptidoglycan DD-metalloendopeptidase family protein, partial [Bacteroidia bacterium]|nr:peptidoglycan DD-metalloendopeptidase family protein [Bacteroidia bacterium]
KEVSKKVARLQKKKDEKKQLLENIESEKNTLAVEKNDQQKIYEELKGKEKQLRKELAEKQRASQKLDASIKKLVEEEIRKSNANVKVKKSDTKTLELKLTPEAEKLSENFESNKGKLPWPVVEGIITQPFGTYSPMPGITMSNSGVEIGTTKGAIARAIFDGTVSVVTEDPDPSLGKLVIIRHGQFLTVYRHLKEVFVKAGEKVQTKQTLGSILYDEQKQMADIELQIWKGLNKLDPQDWLFKKD